MKNKALFSFSVGPVQSFIAQARKLQDLFIGSRILTEMTEEAIKIAKDRYNAEIIMPYEELKSKPNIFLAEFDLNGKNNEEIKDIGSSIENHIKVYFNNAINDTIGKPSEDKAEYIKNQIENHLSINWAMYPYDENSNYYEAFNKSQQLFKEVKSTRTFNQVQQTGRICSICGERVAIFYKGKKQPRHLEKKVAIKVDDNEHKFNEGEALCGVCYHKRIAYKSTSFPSIAEICALDTISELDPDKYKEYKNMFKQHYDEEFLYEENIKDTALKKVGLIFKKDSIKEIEKKRLELLNGIKPKKYYAVIVSDGDKMGNWVSGKFLKDPSQLIDFQKHMSKTLGEYGENLRKFIDNTKAGKVVYNGGDDLLAFINIKHLFSVL
ncbi:MAG: type III-B CRISPR-associated protein Cas10/Cmr2, partial [Spirochaetota bacterium]